MKEEKLGKCSLPLSNNDIDVEVSRTLREVKPAHYLFKIQSFSIFSETNIENYESGDFEAGGYKWKLCLYPNGNKKRNVNDHISLYLMISGRENLPLAWEINVQFKLFVFDHIKDKYLTVQDGDGRIRRFHEMKTEWGFDKFLSMDKFKDGSNGYLFDDCCVFGAEVFVINYGGKGECLSLIKEPKDNIYTWKVQNFSAISKEFLFSEEFYIGEVKWKLLLYPKGNEKAEKESLSVFLMVVDSAKLPLDWKLYAKYKLRIRDQVQNKHCEREASEWFAAAPNGWGYANFVYPSDLSDKSRGFIVNDTLIVQVEILVMSMTEKFT